MTISPHLLLSCELDGWRLLIRIPSPTPRHSEGPKGNEEPAAAEKSKSDSSATSRLQIDVL